MKIYFYIFCFVVFSFFGLAQSFEIYNGDTINRVDFYNCKEGKWRVTGKLKPGTCYQKDQVVEEGKYIANRKTGLWIEYFCNGNMRNKITFIDGRPNGHATLFHENGKIKEEGDWKNNRWVGSFTKQDTLGKVINIIEYDSLGKRKGTKMEVLDNAYEPSYYELNDNFDWKLNHRNPLIVEPRKIEQNTSLPIENSVNHIILNGQQTLYNKNKQITKDGIFKDNRFMDGKAYFYDDNGMLSRIAIYKDGKYIGDAPIE